MATTPEQKTNVAREGALKRCFAWLHRNSSGQRQSWRPRKKRRVKSEQWLRAVDQQLRKSSNEQLSLSFYAVPSDPTHRKSAFDWPALSIAADQGPDGVCALQWASRKANLNFDPVWDLSHIATNSWKAGLAKAGVMVHQRLMAIAWNARHGPWLEGVRWSQATESLEEHVQLVGAGGDDPLFVFLAPKMLEDAGQEASVKDADMLEQLWEDVKEGLPWRRRGSPVSDVRFFASLRESRAEDKVWHHRVYGYTLACLNFDLLHGAKFEELFSLRKVERRSAADAGQGDAAAQESQTLQSAAAVSETSLRKACANLLVLATMLYSDDSNQTLQRIIVAASTPLEQWHSHQNQALRNVSATIPWSLEQLVDGKLVGVCRDTLEVLSCGAGRLRRLGFGINQLSHGDGTRFTNGLVTEDAALAIVDVDGDGANTLGSLVFALVWAFLTKTAWFHRGWPMSSVRLLSEASRAEWLARLQEDRRLFQELSSSGEPHCEALARRSCFKSVPVQQLCGWIDEEGGRVSDKVVGALRKKHARIFCTQVVEDGFHTCRDLENKHVNKTALPRACFEGLVESSVLSVRHKYERLEVEAHPLHRNERVPDSAFNCRSGQATASSSNDPGRIEVQTSDIIGFGATDWYSAKADHLPVQVADLELMAALHRAGQKHLVHRAWLGQFLDAPRLLIRRRGAHAGDWLFALGAMPGSAGLAWPALEVEVPDRFPLRVFVPKLDAQNFEWVYIVDLSDWECLEYEFRSPSWFAQALPETFSSLSPAVRCITRKEVSSLLELGAKRAFWSFGVGFLRNLAAELKLEGLATASLFTVVFELTKHIMCTGDDEALVVCNARMRSGLSGQVSCYNELLECDEAMFFLPKDDEDALRKEKNALKTDDDSRGAFVAEWRSKAATVRGSKSGNVTKAIKRKALKECKVSVKEVPQGDISVREATGMLPPNCAIWFEFRDQNWRGRSSDNSRVSRATLMHGHRGACLAVLRILWQQWLEENLCAHEDCPVAGLFSGRSSSSGQGS